MRYVPGCQYDLFISYAVADDCDGWVEQFEKALGRELNQLLGRQFSPKDSIFFDKRDIEVAQSFPETLTNATRESAILIPVLSPGYLTSPWCDRERADFFSKLPYGAEPAGCLAPIQIRPINDAGLDKRYRDAQRLSFLSGDGQTPLAAGSLAWTAMLQKFAGQIKDALQKLRQKSRPVFLGKAAGTERAQNLRNWLRAEVERRYFRTVPEYLQSLDDPEALSASLRESALAVHFLGEADETTLAAIETSIASCAGPTVLYQPFEAKLTADEQLWLTDFERELKTTSGLYQRLTGKNDQEIVSLIDEQLTKSRPASGGSLPDAEVALICEEQDIAGVRQLKRDIATRYSARVEYPAFLETRLTAMDRLRNWTEYLRRGEAHLFYYGEAERDRLDLIWQKARQNRPDAQRGWYLAPPDLDGKLRQYPDALSNIDQVIQFLKQPRSPQP